MKKFLSYYALPLIISTVIINQFLQVDKGMSKWKGGAFGMYTTFHFQYRMVYLSDSIQVLDMKNKTIKNAVNYLKLRPNDKNAQRLIDVLNIKNKRLSVSVWRPVFNPSNLRFSYALLYEYQPN